MKHDILEEVWRVRDQLATECGHDLIKFGAMLRGEESKYGGRLARLPIRRKTVPGEEQAFTGGPVHRPIHGGPSKPALALHEPAPGYRTKPARKTSA